MLFLLYFRTTYFSHLKGIFCRLSLKINFGASPAMFANILDSVYYFTGFLGCSALVKTENCRTALEVWLVCAPLIFVSRSVSVRCLKELRDIPMISRAEASSIRKLHIVLDSRVNDLFAIMCQLAESFQSIECAMIHIPCMHFTIVNLMKQELDLFFESFGEDAWKLKIAIRDGLSGWRSCRHRRPTIVYTFMHELFANWSVDLECYYLRSCITRDDVLEWLQNEL